MNNQKIGLYVHLPFCQKKCRYCDFCSFERSESWQQVYLQTVLNEMEAAYEDGMSADTLYLGGGTPTLVPLEGLQAILQKAVQRYRFSGEATIEANPNTVTLAVLQQLYEMGYHRISFGVQSAVDAELAALGRLHTARQAEQAVRWARQAGFTNISCDLMLGVPYQTSQTLAQSLSLLGSLPISHVSAYLLKIEPGTPLAQEPDLCAACPDDDAAADLYLQTVETLEQMGLAQYEISNFARPGFESKHNLKYWTLQPYLGFGVAAHSMVRDRRYAHSRDLEAYLRLGLTERCDLEEAGTIEERVMLGLRLTAGLDLDHLARQYRFDRGAFLAKVAPFIQQGWMVWQEGRLRMLPKGFLIYNSIMSEL